MKLIFLGLGTNLGRRQNNLLRAIDMISEHVGQVKAVSSLYETEPWGFDSDNQFLNMVISVETELKPTTLLEGILKIETKLGRTRNAERYSSRVIDIDVLLYDDQIIDENDLKIPHPLMHQRKFVLVPLCEIAAEVEHPVLKKTIKELLNICEDKSIPGKFGVR